MENFSVETFELQYQAETLPPTPAQIEEYLKTVLPLGSRLLQWAICKSDPKRRYLWIEGSYSYEKS